MKKIVYSAIAILLVVAVVALWLVDIPAPSSEVTHKIDSKRFPG